MFDNDDVSAWPWASPTGSPFSFSPSSPSLLFNLKGGGYFNEKGSWVSSDSHESAAHDQASLTLSHDSYAYGPVKHMLGHDGDHEQGGHRPSNPEDQDKWNERAVVLGEKHTSGDHEDELKRFEFEKFQLPSSLT